MSRYMRSWLQGPAASSRSASLSRMLSISPRSLKVNATRSLERDLRDARAVVPWEGGVRGAPSPMEREVHPQEGIRSSTQLFPATTCWGSSRPSPSVTEAKAPGSSTTADRSQERELKTVRPLPSLPPVMAEVEAVVTSAAACWISACAASASSYTRAMEEPGRMSWNWLSRRSFQAWSSFSARDAGAIQRVSDAAHVSASRRATSLFRFARLVRAWDV